MNDLYDCNAIHISTGWIGYYHLAHRPDRMYVTDGGDRIVFPTEQEARNAAQKLFMAALNRSLIGGVITVVRVHKPAARAAAERIFKNGRAISVQRVRASA